MKTLISFFSRAGQNYAGGSIVDLPVGNTQVVAEKIARLIPGATLFHIEAAEPYSSDYMTCTEEAKQELREKARPALKADFDPSEFDTIILGYPNWLGTMPMAVRTWLDAHSFDGKRIVPFCTHEGSGMGHSEADMRKAMPGATIAPGTPIHGSEAASADGQAAGIAALAQ